MGASSKPESERHAESMEDGPLSPIKPDSPSQPTDESVKTGVNASEPVSKGLAILNAAARRAVKDVSAVSAFAAAASNSGLSKDDRIIVEKLRKVHGRCAKVAFQMADRGASWDKLFRLIDKNHDKHLDQEEFMDACRGVLDLSEQAFPDEIVQRVFRLLDEDGGGSIEVQVSNCCNTHTHAIEPSGGNVQLTHGGVRTHKPAGLPAHAHRSVHMHVCNLLPQCKQVA